MADTADVEKALVAVCSGVLFPSGGYVLNSLTASAILAAPPANPSGTPVAINCRLYRGWPSTDTLNADLAAGAAHVSVYPDAGVGRSTTRYLTRWWQTPAATPTLTATVATLTSTSTLTLGGTPVAGQVVTVNVGPGLVPQTYAYAVLASDTPASIAAALAALIPSSSAASAVLTLPSNAVVAAVTQPGAGTWLTRQILQRYQVNIWAPSPHARDALAGSVDAVLARTFRLTMPDGSPTRMTYGGTLVTDLPARQGEWNRRLVMMVEYCTTDIETLPTMAAGIANATAANVTTTTVAPASA